MTQDVRDEADARAMLEAQERVPNDHETQDRWIEAAENPFIRLGRKWLVEQKRSGRYPGGQTPQDIAGTRFKEFWAAFGGADDESPASSVRDMMLRGFVYDGSNPSSFPEHHTFVPETARGKPEPGSDG